MRLPEIVIPDNTKTGVKHPCRYEPELNATYRELAEHYSFAVIPARPYKPRDKAKVEAGVQVAQRWILAALRHRKFFHLNHLNEAIGELLERLNNRPFRKRPDASRSTLFQQLDRPALKPLPAQSYILAATPPPQWKSSTAACGLPRIHAASSRIRLPPFTNIGPRVIRRIWNGLPRA